ncbi:hypothetical protein D5S17_10315 [Pseudonocardiaceae bacterium YIM PH 21723]|nr:hypothetical protein D5S17_10315 [Pseudonocardiaceae bacterium YIM PH 21723]
MSDNSSLEYVTHIQATPEQVWRALTDPGMTAQYWGTTLDTDWRAGSPMAWEQLGVRIEDPAQVVLESDPHRRLSYTWHTFTPEFATSVGLDQELAARLAAERRTKVSFDLEPQGNTVKLTLLHDDFDQAGVLHGMCSEAWPQILAGLKTLVEKS